MGWIYELISNLSNFLTPLIRDAGVPNVYLPDAIIMFVVIPVVHLMNDEETKQVIYERNWYQGFRHMLGMYTKPELQNSTQPNCPNEPAFNRINRNKQKSKVTFLDPKPMSILRRHTTPSLVSSQDVMMAKKEATGQKRHSLPESFLIQQIEVKKSTTLTRPSLSSINRINPSEQKTKVTLLSPRPMLILRRCLSNLSLDSSKDVKKTLKQATGQRRNSLSEVFLIQQISSHSKTQM